MISLSISTDYGLIRQILTEARSFRRLVNDSAPARDDLKVGPCENITYVLARMVGEPVAVFLLIAKGPNVAEIHFTMMPAVWGQSERVASAFLDWVWRETSLNRLIAEAPSYNRLGLRLAKAVGFRENGSKKSAKTKHGKPFDLITLSLERNYERAVA